VLTTWSNTVAERVPLCTEIPLADFEAKVILPLDLTLAEAQRITQEIDNHALLNECDPSEAAKYAVSDPNVYSEIVE
jgi:hypothetical protein